MEPLIKLKKLCFVVTRVEDFLYSKNDCNIRGDSADLTLAWFSGEVFQGERVFLRGAGGWGGGGVCTQATTDRK